MKARFFAYTIFVIFVHLRNVNTELEQLPYCDPSTKNTQQSLVYVSTLDGKISALDLFKGEIKWTFGLEEKPLLLSNIHRRELNNNGQWVRLIPSLRGALYKFDGENVEYLPVTAERLLKSSFRYSDDLVFSGGKETCSYGIVSSTGKVVYKCNLTGCTNSTDRDTYDEEEILVIQRYQHTVRAVDPRSGIERWNFSVGQHELSLIHSPNSDCSDKKSLNVSDIEIKVVVPEGLVWAVNKSNPLVNLWKYKFDSPIVSVWRENKDIVTAGEAKLKEVNLFDKAHWTSEFNGNPALYVAMHEKQLYIQENPIHGKTADHSLSSSSAQLTVFPWRPLPVITFEETESLTNENEMALSLSETQSTTAISVLYNSEYINGNGFYLYSSEQMELSDNYLCNKTIEDDIIEENVSSMGDKDSKEDISVQIMIVSIWYYWKEVFVISLVTAVLINCMFDSKLNFLRKKAKETLLPVVDGQLEVKRTEERKISIGDDEYNFSSRFQTDFDPVICLGKGGFGIVFEATNKIDDCHYAIKRITLPNSQDSRDRVMREVKALAKLEHQNIVRYFNAWLECPPIGWQEEQDEMLQKNGVIPVESDFTYEPSHTETETETKPDNFSLDDYHNSLSSAFDARELCNDDDDDDNFIQFQYLDDEADTDAEKMNSQSLRSSNDSEGSVACNKDENIQNIRISNDNSESIVFENSGNNDSESIVFEYSDNHKNKKSDDKIIKENREKLSGANSIVEEKPRMTQKAPRMYLYIQMQLCQRKSLRDWLKHCDTTRDLTRAINIFQQIVDAVEYVHLKGLIHRDLKPSNIFFAYDDKIKIGDFGLVTAMPDSTPSPVHLDGLKVNNNKQSKEVIRTAQVGTQLYMSPEQMNGKIYNYKVDIYSLGIILFELLTPFSTDMERIKSLTNLRRSIFPDNFSIKYPAEYDLLKLMLENDPNKRPTTLGIKARPPLCNDQHVNKTNVSFDDQWHFELPAISRHSSSSNTEVNNTESTSS